MMAVHDSRCVLGKGVARVEGKISPSFLPTMYLGACTYVPPTTILSFHHLHPPRRRLRRHDPFLRYRQSSTRNEVRGGEAEPSLCCLTRSLLNYCIKTIRQYSSVLNIFTKVPLCSFSRVRAFSKIIIAVNSLLLEL